MSTVWIDIGVHFSKRSYMNTLARALMDFGLKLRSQNGSMYCFHDHGVDGFTTCPVSQICCYSRSDHLSKVPSCSCGRASSASSLHKRERHLIAWHSSSDSETFSAYRTRMRVKQCCKIHETPSLPFPMRHGSRGKSWRVRRKGEASEGRLCFASPFDCRAGRLIRAEAFGL